MMTQKDIDEQAIMNAIIHNLQAEGYVEWADKLSGAIEGGATGTEISMALRWNLQQIRQTCADLTDETKRLVDNMITSLSRRLAGR
jgi:hypothetical protein